MCEISSLICRPTKRQKSSHHRSPCDNTNSPGRSLGTMPGHLSTLKQQEAGRMVIHISAKKLQKKTFLGFVPLLNYWATYGNLYSSIYINVLSIRWTAQLWFFTVHISVFVFLYNKVKLYSIVHVTIVVLTCALYCYLTLRVSFSLPQNHDLFTGFFPCFACLAWFTCDALRFL